MPNRNTVFLAACVAALLLAGCASQKEPAAKLIAEAEATLAEYKDDAARFAPEQMKALEARIASLKEQLQKGDYKDILADSPELTRAVAALKDTSTAKKAEFEAALAAAKADWATLSAELPGMVEAIQARVDALGKARRLPKNLDPDQIAAARAKFEEMKTSWDEASSAFLSGDAAAAVESAKAIKARGAEVMAELGMTQPADGG